MQFFDICGKSLLFLFGGAVIGTFLMIVSFMILIEKISGHVFSSLSSLKDQGKVKVWNE